MTTPIPEGLKILLRFFTCLPHHDLVRLFDMVELGMNELKYETCDEEELAEHFLTSFWLATKRRGSGYRSRIGPPMGK